MIPAINELEIDEGPLAEQPSLTWGLDVEKGKVIGKIDGLDAVRQAVFKILQTDRYWHVIYSTDYGHELSSLIGDHPIYMESELKRMIEEALLVDERIESVDQLEVAIDGESAHVSFRVNSIYGSFDEEVSTNV